MSVAKTERKTGKPKKSIIILSSLALLILCMAIAIFIFLDMMHSEIYETPKPTSTNVVETITLPPQNGDNPGKEPIEEEPNDLPLVYSPEDDIDFILLFGLADYNLADTVWVAIINKTKGKTDFLSIPRDTYLRYADADRDHPDHWKINSYYNQFDNGTLLNLSDAESSMALLGACEVLLGIDMDYYVRISYDTIEQVVDAIGGIEYEIPFDMIYHDFTEGAELHIEIFAGYQTLSGEDVVKFLRFRQGVGYDGVSDIARIKRQQVMIKTILRKAFSLSNISSVIEISKANIRTNLSKDVLSSYITYALKQDLNNVSFHTLKGHEETINTNVKDALGNDMMRSFYLTNNKDILDQLKEICE